ncbi:MAG TPA: type 4a pilus biogenesis protein PilO [Thermoanaerobaculia bacterium]|nr:type 4a pilus biogenesis protein PilO [Thermoanaerobaculia bacterium]
MALTLEGKPIWIALVIGLVLAVVIVGVVQYMFITDIDTKIRAADARIKELDTKIQQGQAAKRTLPQFKEEVHRLELDLEKLRRILPSTRNTEEIIKKLKSLVDQGDFILHKLTFPKLAPPKEGGEPYAEWPISVQVDGRYHNLAILFNRLSNFSRIMNVEQINITALGNQAERTITSDFVAKTFVYVEPKEPEKTSEKKKP